MTLLRRLCSFTILLSLMMLSACDFRPLQIQPYFDGVRTGTYTYSTEVEGVTSEVTSSIRFDVEEVARGESEDPYFTERYTFQGTLELAEETYTVKGFEELPDQVKLKPQVYAIDSATRVELTDSQGDLIYTLCGEHFYGTGGYASYDFEDRGVTLAILRGPVTEDVYCPNATKSYGAEEFDVAGIITMAGKGNTAP